MFSDHMCVCIYVHNTYKLYNYSQYCIYIYIYIPVVHTVCADCIYYYNMYTRCIILLARGTGNGTCRSKIKEGEKKSVKRNRHAGGRAPYCGGQVSRAAAVCARARVYNHRHAYLCDVRTPRPPSPLAMRTTGVLGTQLLLFSFQFLLASSQVLAAALCTFPRRCCE